MVGTGTVINALGVLAGGILGLLFGKILKKRYQDILNSACGISTIFIGISGALQKIFSLNMESGQLETTGTMMMIASLCIGAVLGEWMNIEHRTEQLGEWLKIKSRSEGDTSFVDGFVTTSLTICIGAMAILGPIQDALYGDYSILLAKAILDAVIVLALTSAYGKGCIFSVIPIIVFEGGITVLAKLIEPVMTAGALHNISLVGSMLITCVGINLVFGKKVKVANLLPSLIIAVIYSFLPL